MHKHQLTPVARELLSILRANGDWMNRQALADALQQKSLNFHCVGLLEKMAAGELIDARKVITGHRKYYYEYRAKQP
jgi:hypothetical protein